MWRVVVLGLMLMAGPAAADDWRVLGANNRGAWAIDFASLAGNGNKVRAWVLYTLAQTDGNVDYSLTRYEFDCDAESSTSLSSARYNFGGETVATLGPSYEWTPIYPSSGGMLMFRAACRNQWDDVGPGLNNAVAQARVSRRALTEQGAD